jgi:hypothetical protein
MLRRFIYTVLTLILIFSGTLYSQVLNGTAKPPVNERIFFGGSFSLALGTITNIEFAPIAGIWLFPRVSVAAGPTYQFYKDPFDRTDIFGVRTYMQYVVIQDINKLIPIGANTAIFIHGEYEALSLENSFWTTVSSSSKRFGINTMLGGLGFNQPLGIRSSVNLMILWAITENNYGIYDNPEIRVGFIF